jgi:hypothetical protein
MFYGVVAMTLPWQEIRPFKLSSYISNDNTLLTLWLNFSVTVSNDGSCITPSPDRFGPHPLNQFTFLFLAHMLLNQRLDGTNSFVAALLPSGKMPSSCNIRTGDLEPSLHLTTNGCALLLMLFGPLPLHYGASATTNYMDTMDTSPLSQMPEVFDQGHRSL